MQKLSASEIKSELLKMMSYLASYCDAHGIRYYIFYGTLLGAVRHKGFIPWDDDVDLIMPRDDYNRLIASFETEPFEEPYGLISYEQGNTVYPFAKMVHHKTVFKGKTSLGDKELWVDIFPLDYVPDERSENRKLFETCGRLLMWHTSSTAIPFTGSTPLRALVRGPVVLYARTRGYQYYNRKIMKTAEKYRNVKTHTMGNLCWPSTYDVPFDCKDLEEYEDLEFEGMKFHAMKNYDKYLREYYGDYMKLPPMSQRQGHMSEIYLTE